MITIICRIDEEPVVAEIENSLETLQEIVEGYIEGVTLVGGREPIMLICNEEGIRLGLPFNRCGILGNFVITKANEEGESISLSKDDITTFLLWCKTYKNTKHMSML